MPHLSLSVLLSLSLYSLGTASAISIELVDKLNIKAIKSINLIKTNEELRASVVVQFSTSAPVALKFKKANFAILFKSDDGTQIYLGTTQSEELIFPASEAGSEKLIEEKLDVFVGKNEADTINRLIQLFNLIGNPDSEFEMILSGSTKIGTRAKRGWIYQGRVEIEDFIFYPTIQREVLFK